MSTRRVIRPGNILETRASRRWAVALVGIGLILFTGQGRAAEISVSPAAAHVSPEPSAAPQCAVCTPIEMWVVNTRCLGSASNQCGVFDGFCIQRLDHGTLTSSSHQEFLQSLTPETIICVFIDGNRIDTRSAIERGLAMKRRLSGDQNVRLVVWSWPSDRIRGLVKDARAKTHRSDVETYYLGSWLSRLPADQRVSLIAYSLGARIATGALHLLGGGQFNGNSLHIDPANSVRPRAVLIASAVPGYWLTPGRAQGLALPQTSGALSVYNPRDAVLKAFQFATHEGRSNVLGHQPLVTSRRTHAELRQLNVAKCAGNSHQLDSYLNSGSLGLVRAYSLWHAID